jgi:SAM-dependent methyltransferase
MSDIKSYYEGLVEPIYRQISGAILHLGMFEGDELREVATRRTKEFLASRLATVSSTATIVDLGSGYGDSARFLAQRFGCHVVGLNLVHNQNLHALTLNRDTQLEEQVSLIEADFSHVPLFAGLAQVVWSQEALLHAPDRARVLDESARLLAAGGVLIFTDILQVGPMAPNEARLIYERVKITSLETFASYQKHLRTAGLAIKEVVDLSRYVAGSYADHVDSLRQHRHHLIEAVGAEYVDYTISAMERWVRAAEAGKLGWGMFVAQKP